MHKQLFTILLISVFCPQLIAQIDQLSNRRSTKVKIDAAEIYLDSLTILPNSIQIYDQENNLIEENQYEFSNNQLQFLNPEKLIADNDSVVIQYRVLPYDLGASKSHLDSTNIKKADDGTYIGYDFNPYNEPGSLGDLKGLDYNGSFARGISFGNNQNLVLNSSFNLQMAGNLGDDVEVLAAITDNNIPLQPEGNTQQLQEFDKIFIQLKRKNSKLIAGDYEIKKPHGYFLNYYKKLQGATFENNTLLNKGTLDTKASVAIARGRFARNILTTIEGNQGPYKLVGNEGEQFIIVLAGTEKVFIDGVKMTRGIEQDYIVDYNRGDITFTARRLISKDTRIVVEFEYSDQNYLRSLYAVNAHYQQEKSSFYVNVYSEQDSKNSGGAQDLSVEEKQLLANIKDDDDAFISGIDTLNEFSEFRVKYKLVDTTAFNTTYSILAFSTNPDSALYTATFLQVNEGQGNYVRIQSNANGPVYEWVAPDANGVLQGNFEPIRRLVTPNKKQLITVGGTYDLNKQTKAGVEFAYSNNDPNRFSEINAKSNNGGAVYTNIVNQKSFGTVTDTTGKKTDNWLFETKLNYEYIHENFSRINPYRPTEFTRDWNLSTVQNGISADKEIEKAAEQLGSLSLKLKRQKFGEIEYGFGTFLRQDIYEGFKHEVKSRINKNGFRFNLEGSLLTTNTNIENTSFFRPKVELAKSFKKLKNWTLGVQAQQEVNSRKDAVTDTLNFTSFNYDQYRVYLESPVSKQFSFGANYTHRNDYGPQVNKFSASTSSDDINLYGSWNTEKASKLRWNFSVRQLEIINETLTQQKAEETYLGRLEHQLKLFKGVVRSSTVYEIGSGQEPKIEYQYVPVPDGEGIYQWTDRNEDGAVTLDEVEVAVFQDQANLARFTIFTNEFIRTNNIQFNQSLRLDPRSVWYKEKKLKKALSKFSTQSTLQINRRTLESNDVLAWNPFQLSIADTSLVTISSVVRNTLFFNRADPKYDIQVGMFDSRNRRILTTGFESINNEERFISGRWNLNKKFSAEVKLSRGNRIADSEFFNNRDFNIQFEKVEPAFTYFFSKKIRTILKYKYQDSENILMDGGETASINDFNIETTFNQKSNTSFRLRVSYVDIQFEGERNTPVEFAMLDGLQNGRNFLWNLTFDKKIAKNIQLSMSYEGRKTGSTNVIHVGRAQVRATF